MCMHSNKCSIQYISTSWEGGTYMHSNKFSIQYISIYLLGGRCVSA